MMPNQIPAADPEVVALGSALVDVIAAAKKPGSTALGDAEAALPDLMAAIGAASNVVVDMKKPANQVFLIYAIASALEPSA